MVPEPELKSRPTLLCLLLESKNQIFFQSIENLVPSCQSWYRLCDRTLGSDMLLLSPQLYRLCWSLRNSQEEREDLDAGVQRKRLGPSEKEEPGTWEGILFRVFWGGCGPCCCPSTPRPTTSTPRNALPGRGPVFHFS